ncbi:MaoC-like dehydratase domain-containing protein [Planoprotostelium fungivorum]|uniref:MaoC-like dehydratase domain-containing protein n=1 Tax=Planoprotostelium fungivorum TaxID=1890364 RepID=A0A2P6NF45_9EUKA|nr:MaoC-like dehydratase domain-containing protein [Planoprotostelium fungivorum]
MDTTSRRIAQIAGQIEPTPVSASVVRELLVNQRQRVNRSVTLNEWKSLVGKELGVGQWFTVTQDRVNAFADATGDFQWIHTDPDRAKKESPFGSTIAHGYLTLSLLPLLMEEIIPKIEGAKMGVNYGLNKVRFISPVHVGSRIRVRAVLQETTTVPSGVQNTLQVTVERENEKKPVALVECLARVYV